jgi:hypothetical protein
MKNNLGSRSPDHLPVPHGMVDMRMCIHDIFDRQFMRPGFLEKQVMVVGRIYEQAFLGLLISDQIAEDTKIANLKLSDNHDLFSNPSNRIHHTLL